MKGRVFTGAVGAAVFALAGWPAWAQDNAYVFTKLPLSGEGTETVTLSPHDVVLVEVRIRRGDSLWKFARRHLKHPSRYAQLLAYNPSITNPRRIIAGRTILVPEGLLKDRWAARKIARTRWVVHVPEAMSVSAVRPETPTALPSPADRSPTAAPAARADSAGARSDEARFVESERLFHRGRYGDAARRLESLLEEMQDGLLRVRAELLLAECYRMLSGGR